MWTSSRCLDSQAACCLAEKAPAPSTGKADRPAPSDDDGECSTCAPFSRQGTLEADGGPGPCAAGGALPLLVAVAAALGAAAARAPGSDAARSAVWLPGSGGEEDEEEDDAEAAGRMFACARRLALGAARAAAEGVPGSGAAAALALGAP